MWNILYLVIDRCTRKISVGILTINFLYFSDFRMYKWVNTFREMLKSNREALKGDGNSAAAVSSYSI